MNLKFNFKYLGDGINHNLVKYFVNYLFLLTFYQSYHNVANTKN